MAGNQRTGKAYIYIDGTLYETMSGAKLSGISGLKREAVIGSEAYGYSEAAVATELDCSFAHGSGISAEVLGAITDSEIQFECDSGPIFVMTGAFLTEGPDLDVDGHKLDCKFQCVGCQEQLS